MNIQKKIAIGFINDICNKEYALAESKLTGLVDEKIKARIRRIASELDQNDAVSAKK